jgi:hypothetical protein
MAKLADVAKAASQVVSVIQYQLNGQLVDSEYPDLGS